MQLSVGKLMLGVSYVRMHRSVLIGNEYYTSQLGHQGVLPSGNQKQKKKHKTKRMHKFYE